MTSDESAILIEKTNLVSRIKDLFSQSGIICIKDMQTRFSLTCFKDVLQDFFFNKNKS